jgi:hypothetical protein
MNSKTTSDAYNQIYYFQIGRGKWEGSFSLLVTDWASWWQHPIGFRNRLLVLAMVVCQKLVGASVVNSDLLGYPEQGIFGIATNTVRIHKWGLTQYLLQEEYDLDPDGAHVKVRSTDHFGPIPFLFRDSMDYPAEIHAGGMSSTYYMPLLGDNWICDYTVQPDRNHVAAVLRSPWAEAHEIIHRVG